MTGIHFKLAYNEKTYRFVSTLQGGHLLKAVKSHFASIVKEDDYKLCWNDGESTMLLDTEDDFSDMLEYAKEEAKSSTKPPCIRLTVNDSTAREVPAAEEPATPEATEKKVEEDDEEEEEEKEASASESSDEDEDENAVRTDATAPVAADSPTAAQPGKNASALQAMLDSAEKKHRAEMEELATLAEELETNTEKRLTVESFSLRPTLHPIVDGGDVQFNLSFKSLPDYSLWKKCVEAALFTLELPDSSLFAHKSPNFRGTDEEWYNLNVDMESKNVKSVLEYLKPIARRTDFETVTVDVKEAKYVRMLPEFLDGATIKTITMNSARPLGKSKKMKPADFELALNLLQALKPNELNYYRSQATQDLFDFLENAADLVKNLRINSVNFEKKKEKSIPLSLAQNILSRKCNYLTINDSATKVTLAEAEELVKFFEEKEMKVSLAVPTKEKKVDNKLGAYRVKLANLNSQSRSINQIFKHSQILIEHEEMDPKMEEMEESFY